MEHIRQAVERARGTGPLVSEQQDRKGLSSQPPRRSDNLDPIGPSGRQIELRPAHLETQRIVAHDTASVHSKPYDMLRTQVLQAMDKKGWHFLAITSPTPGCGKTLTAINLALSIARQPERSVLLVDMDLQKPKVASSLGLAGDQGLFGLLEGRTGLSESMVQARICGSSVGVLPVETSIADSSQWMSSRAMSTVLQELRGSFRSSIVIFDLPPILYSDDVISVLPHMDCVLFVTAVGASTVSDIKECNKFLQMTDVVRVVVNKVDEPTPYYYGMPGL